MAWAPGWRLLPSSYPADHPHAFRWSAATGMIDLGGLASGSIQQSIGLDMSYWQKLEEARGISADGRNIVGYGINASGDAEAFLAHIPEPGTAVLLLIGWAVAARRRT